MYIVLYNLIIYIFSGLVNMESKNNTKPISNKSNKLLCDITDTIKVPLNFIISMLKKDDDIEKYLTQDEINYIVTMIHDSKLPSNVNNTEEIIDSIKNIIKLYLDNKNQLLTIGSSVATKYITDKIRRIITKYKYHQFKKLKIKKSKKTVGVKRLHRK